MRIFLYAPACNSTIAMARRLVLRGYDAEHAAASHFTGQPDEAQLRARTIQLLRWCDAVAVPEDAITPEELSRLLVVCEFAGRTVVRYEDLPGEAPADGILPVVISRGTRVYMIPQEQERPGLLPEVARKRIQLLVERSARFFDNGRWLKNPLVRPH